MNHITTYDPTKGYSFISKSKQQRVHYPILTGEYMDMIVVRLLWLLEGNETDVLSVAESIRKHADSEARWSAYSKVRDVLGYCDEDE